MTNRYVLNIYLNERYCFKAHCPLELMVIAVYVFTLCAILYNFLTQVVLCISVDVSSKYSQVESVIKQVK